jgi:hypothetical protein
MEEYDRALKEVEEAIKVLPKPETYTKQLRALEGYASNNPKAVRRPLPSGLHYLVLGSVPEAVKQLKEFETPVPKDPLVR